MTDFEKLGVFYLGKEYDLAASQRREAVLLYDSKDLVTHAVVVGMTGSGKTGLCLALLEEAAIDGVPAIIIDPKGDLPNLLLTFPQLRGEDLRPWINEDEAAKKGLTPEAFAQAQADLWKKGLAEWGQDGARIERLRAAAEVAVYTPGSSAGLPVSILKSFAAPGPVVLEDGELLRERINTTVTSLLGLLNVQADPLQSREHILIANLLENVWRQGQDLDLAALIGLIQNPPLTKIGVLDLESFYPGKDRFGLVMALNNLLAAPGFGAWLEGEPLDIQSLLYTAQGRPRHAIFSIAHLNDAERMFFVSLLLNQVLGWVRQQSGTTSLRALLYMDEIFGYFPPVANPPSKQPLLTLLKQARAFGLGVVLATQNPVDLDYKGLANTGTWFIGRLQTDRDKQRVLDGLEGAAASGSAGFDRGRMEQILAGLGNRVFLMNNVHDDAPVVFTTRWVMSYLRGPLTRQQIKALMDPYKAARLAPASAAAAPPPAAASAQPAGSSVPVPPAAPARSALAAAGRPSLPPEIPQFFLPVRGQAEGLVYRPALIGAARVNFAEAKSKVDVTEPAVLLTPITDAAVPVDWAAAQPANVDVNDLEKGPAEGAQFAELPAAAAKPKSYAAWGRDLTAHLYGGQKLELFRSPSQKLVSEPGEAEREFRARLAQAAREHRDAATEALKKKYAPKLTALQERLRRAEAAKAEQEAQAKQAQLNTAISFGATLLGAFVGRKGSSLGRATTAARGVGRAMKEGQDIGRAQETVEALQQQLADLDAQFKAEAAETEARVDPLTEPLETLVIKPKKTGISVQLLALVWAPYAGEKPAWE
ncbi:MAG: ATP-binding protein [Anaerolineales bacterium]|nr:ATP-binding protein [Anaerolineales bacterium]